MDVRDAVERVLLGESLRMLAIAHREELVEALGLDVDAIPSQEYWDDTRRFMNRLCRELGDRHCGDSRASAALCEWVQRVDDYEAFDSLLANFDDFEGRELLVQTGER